MRGMGLLAGWAVACLPAFAQFQSVPPPQPLDEIATLATASARKDLFLNAGRLVVGLAKRWYGDGGASVLPPSLSPATARVAGLGPERGGNAKK